MVHLPLGLGRADDLGSRQKVKLRHYPNRGGLDYAGNATAVTMLSRGSCAEATVLRVMVQTAD